MTGALAERAPAQEADPDIFDRATTVPTHPPDASRLDVDYGSPPRRGPTVAPVLPTEPPSFFSEPPTPSAGRAAVLPGGGGAEPRQNAATVGPERRGAPFAPGGAGTLPLPGAKLAGEPQERGEDRKRTAPQPVVERYLDRMETGAQAPADRLERQRSSPPDPAASEDRSTPLDLVETHRRSTQNIRAQPADQKEERGKIGSRESGTLEDMQDRYAVGDFTGALVVAESILDSNPDHEDAKRYAQGCREVLTQMYAARIGPMEQVAQVAVPPDQITWLSLDHRAGFLLSLVDGVSSIEEILDVSGMTRLDALRIMYTLVQQNVIALGH